MNYSTEKLRVRVERVLYPPEESDRDFFIIRTDEGICKGNLAWRPVVNERLILEGSWSAYKGQREFKFKAATPDVPIDQRDMLNYVCDRTHGIGMAIAEAIWRARGEDWRNVTEQDVKALGRGDLLARFRKTTDTVELEAEKSQVIAWLMGKGATIKMASAAWEAWEKQTIGLVTSDPYKLAELPHYGFYHVELGVRQAFGITDDDPRRIKAGILYSLEQLTGENGSTAIDWPTLRDRALKNLGSLYLDKIAALIGEMFKTGTLRGFDKTQRIALGKDYQHEEAIYEFVN